MSTQQLLLGAAGGVAWRYLGDAGVVGGSRSSTSDAMSFGAPGAKRLIIASVGVVTGGGIGGYPTSCTIGGVAATMIANGTTGNFAGATTGQALFYALVPTGSSGNVDVTYNTNVFSYVVNLWALYEYQNAVPYANTGFVAQPPPTDAALYTSMNVKAGGITLGLIGVTLSPFAPTPSTAKSYDSPTNSGFYRFEHSTPADVTAQAYGQNTGRTIILANWR